MDMPTDNFGGVAVFARNLGCTREKPYVMNTAQQVKCRKIGAK